MPQSEQPSTSPETTGAENDLDYLAWTIISNVSGGDWSKQTDEWRRAAIRWRDDFHAKLHAERIDPNKWKGLP
jgi:hypothetical protein